MQVFVTLRTHPIFLILSLINFLNRQAQAWLNQIGSLQNAEHYPYLETLEAIVAKARPIPVYFDVLSGVSLCKSKTH